MGRHSKWEYFKAIYGRYRKACQRIKSQILDEFCCICGYNRKYAIRKLNGALPEERPKRPHHPRGYAYSPQVISILAAVWEGAGYPWSLRLKALLRLWMPWIRQRFAHHSTTRRATARHQSQADGSALETQEGATEEKTLRSHQARHFAQTPHPHPH